VPVREMKHLRKQKRNLRKYARPMMYSVTPRSAGITTTAGETASALVSLLPGIPLIYLEIFFLILPGFGTRVREMALLED